MSELPGVQNWLPDAGARALHTVRRHIAAETTADTDLICSTVSRNVFFAVPIRTRKGNEIPPGTVLTSYDEVYDYYAKRAESYVVVASSQLRSISSDWYVFNESAATLRPGDGPEFVVNSAILFPTDDDGIRGEICITRHPFADVAAGQVPKTPVDASFPAVEMRNAALLDTWLAALQQEGAEGVTALLSPTHSLALRLDDPQGTPSIHSARDGAAVARSICEIFSGSRDVALVSRVVSAWYVFGEYAVSLEGGAIRRIALVQSCEGGRLTSSFGYGWEDA
jgi:hypothetical protein